VIFSAILEAGRTADGWWRRPDAVRAFGYALLASADSDYADELHKSKDDRPFTASALEDRDRIRARVTALDDRTAHVLVTAVTTMQPGYHLSFVEARLPVQGWSLHDAATGAATYSDLANSPFRPRVAFRFVTPTSFSQGGDHHLPLPVPNLVLRSWARRWNLFCGDDDVHISEETLASVIERVEITEARIETAVAHVYNGRIVGFTGTVELEALTAKEWSPSCQSAFSALTAYSVFCGTGVRTTQGLGLTLPLELTHTAANASRKPRQRSRVPSHP